MKYSLLSRSNVLRKKGRRRRSLCSRPNPRNEDQIKMDRDRRGVEGWTTTTATTTATTTDGQTGRREHQQVQKLCAWNAWQHWLPFKVFWRWEPNKTNLTNYPHNFQIFVDQRILFSSDTPIDWFWGSKLVKSPVRMKKKSREIKNVLGVTFPPFLCAHESESQSSFLLLYCLTRNA